MIDTLEKEIERIKNNLDCLTILMILYVLSNILNKLKNRLRLFI